MASSTQPGAPAPVRKVTARTATQRPSTTAGACDAEEPDASGFQDFHKLSVGGPLLKEAVRPRARPHAAELDCLCALRDQHTLGTPPAQFHQRSAILHGCPILQDLCNQIGISGFLHLLQHLISLQLQFLPLLLSLQPDIRALQSGRPPLPLSQIDAAQPHGQDSGEPQRDPPKMDD